MNVLLVYPRYPKTFWSFEYALSFINKKTSLPPLGLLTIAAMLPKDWNLKLIDMNIKELKDDDIKWADLVLISAMSVQKASANEVIQRCKKYGVKIAAGGPLFTVEYELYSEIDYLIIGEGEIVLHKMIEDFMNGITSKVYKAESFVDLRVSPIPYWELIENINDYATLSIQYSRGCPFSCDFCNVTSMFGHKVRTKSSEQIILELEKIYNLGWRGGVFFVDDNFIANKNKVKNDLLPKLILWMKDKGYPFEFLTQVSINIAEDDELIDLMIKAGFDTVFIGIETPNEESLKESSKFQNIKVNMLNSIKKLHNKGLQVQGGFIVGFDNDQEDVFEKQINFIQESGIISAMVGILNAPPGTKLYERLKKENRLVDVIFTGNNTDIFFNFIPKIEPKKLVDGYLKIVNTIYSPTNYYGIYFLCYLNIMLCSLLSWDR
ncbi:B12-binding domain-containing radical SAM protein, partial [Deferribacter thermophilus]|uniref:B12-binding domain-containing radical SAM protein n=1 Tax=Deferribacter thermophilus TaxID=53573 RepID=UPI003C205A93